MINDKACPCPWKASVGPSLASNCGGSALFLFMTLLESAIRTECDIENTCERLSSMFRPEPDYEYDFIVVGGGTAGSVLASRLSEEPQWKVLLIEAGDREPVGNQVPSMQTFWGTDVDWKYKTEPEKGACLNKGGVCDLPRGKLLGGTGALGSMTHIRGNPWDYERWQKFGNPGWNYYNILSHFRKSEDNLQTNSRRNKYHKRGGLLPITQLSYHPPMTNSILKGGVELGYKVQDLNGFSANGFAVAQTTSKGGVRYSTARAFLGDDVRRRRNLHILPNTRVRRVLIDSEKKKALGVVIFDEEENKERKIFVTREVIVSGGAVSSPQILLLSGVGPKEDLIKVGVELKHDLPGVGKNLMSHVSYNVKYFLNESDVNPLDTKNLDYYISKRGGAMAGVGINDVVAKFSSQFSKSWAPDTQLSFSGYLASCSKDGLVGGLLSNGSRQVTIAPTVLKPLSRGYVSLASNNSDDNPRIVTNYLTQSNDLKVLLNGINFANKLAETTPLKRLGMKLDRTPVKGCENSTFGTDSYWECAVRRDTAPQSNLAGSCKMGPRTDRLAVVDHELRVHGLKNLRVIDSSIMPEIIAGNTMTTTIMIAEKGADIIKTFWGAWGSI